MKRVFALVALLIALALLAEPSTADAGIKIRLGIGHGGHHHHGHHHHGHHHHGHYHGGYGHRSYGYHSGYFGSSYRSYRGYYYPRTYRLYSYPYYRSYYPSYSYGYGCASTGYSYPGVVVSPVAPIYADASKAYGPVAVREFLGLDGDYAKVSPAAKPLIVDVNPAGEGPRVVARTEERDERVASNAEARARAARFVSYGDDKFGEQEYHSAAQRYRFAIDAAPDIAGAHFRQGFAYIASNRFDLAAKAFRRGLELDPLWVNSSFRINDLYDRNALAKGSHIDALAKSALIDRGNADYYFLLGVMLHFDDQQERAQKFFERAEKLAGDDGDHIHAFLVPPMPRAEDAI